MFRAGTLLVSGQNSKVQKYVHAQGKTNNSHSHGLNCLKIASLAVPIQTQVVGVQEGVTGAGLRRTVTSSVTLWAIHAGQSDWMPDWIIRNSVEADLKRKTGKVQEQEQHWVGGTTHTCKQCRF